MPHRPFRMYLAGLLTVASTTLAVADEARGQAESTEAGQTDWARGDARDVFSGSPDDVLSNLRDLKFDRKGITRFDPFTLLQDEMRKVNNWLDKQARIRIGFAWTALYQHATKSSDHEDASSGDFDFFGRWRPLQTRETMGFLIFSTEVRHLLFNDIPPSDLGAEIGSLWPTTSGFNVRSFEIRQLYWQQFLFGNTFTYRVGKLDQSNVFNLSRLQSANFFFLNSAFSDNPTMAYPANGFGTDLTWRPNRSMYLSYGISDATSEPDNDGGFDQRLANANWFTVAEFGFTPWIDGLGGGHYRVTGWFTDTSESGSLGSGSGVSLSFDQDLGPKYLAFLRYGYSDGNLTDTRQIVAGGLGFKRPLSGNDDYAGVAAAWGRPTDGSLPDQWVVEAFYRFQLTPAIQVTPDAQLIIDPSNAPGKDAIGVFGVRLRIAF